jgi:hypothetical protein
MALALVFALALVGPAVGWADEGSDENIYAVGKTIPVGDPSTGDFLQFSITAEATADTPGTVRLVDGTKYQGSLVLYQVEYGDFTYAVTSVGANAFKGNYALTSIEFQSDLTGASPAVGANAFEQCRNLVSVVFPQKVAGIGNYAFLRCTSLSSVTFVEGAELYFTVPVGSGLSPALGANAFERCTALKTITIPAITSTQRSPDYYGRYGGSDSSLNATMYSGYENLFNTGSTVPVFSWAIGGSAFKDCESLEAVVFEPSGAQWGLFAYFNQDTPYPVFAGCGALTSVVYGAEQPYYADYDRAILPGYTPSYRNVYEASGVAPDLYYAVNYYATADEALVSGDDAFAGGRYGRVEYLRNTPTAAIATGDAVALEGSVFFDASAYAHSGYADGAVPNPKQVAVEAGLDTADSSLVWIWRLGGTQSRRAGLSDSCYAYLAPASELSAGRVGASQIATMYKLCGQNLSQGQEPVTDSPFDVARYYTKTSGDRPGFEPDHYIFELSDGVVRLFLDEGETAWFTLDSTVEESFFNQIQIYAADGTPLDASSYDVSFERYVAESGEYVAAALTDEQDGPLLMTITPGVESGYTGILREWVLIKGYAGSLRESYTASPTGTQKVATYYNGGANSAVSSFGGPYAVAISSADAPSALIAASYAGLTSAPINVLDTESTSYGFALSTHFLSGAGRIDGALTTFPATDRSPSEFAVAVFEVFEERQRSLLGASEEDYPWGDTAVLITPGSVQDVAAGVAAWAYAKAAPVFYTEDDGSVSEATLACLKQFDRVVVLGDEALFSKDAYDAFDLSLKLSTAVATFSDEAGVKLERICGDAGSAFSLSLAVASLLADEGLAGPSVVTISDATGVADVLAALNLSGHEGGLTLVSACTADSKRISAFLREQRDDVSVIRLFGRDASHMSAASFDLYDSLRDLWSERDYANPQTGKGDTLVLYGAQLKIKDDNSLTFEDRLWGSSKIAAGAYEYGGQSYVLAEAVDVPADPPNSDDPSDTPTDKPKIDITKPSVTNPVKDDPADDPKEDDPADDPKEDDPADDPRKDDPADDPKEDDPADESTTDTKQTGHLTVSSSQVDTTPAATSATRTGSLVSSSSNTGSNPTGTLGISQVAIEHGGDNNALADDGSNTGDNALDDNALADASATGIPNNLEGSEAETDQQAVTDPRVAAAVVGSAIAALAAALFFALHRRKPAVDLAEA